MTHAAEYLFRSVPRKLRVVLLVGKLSVIIKVIRPYLQCLDAVVGIRNGIQLSVFTTKVNGKSAWRRREHCALAVVRRSLKFSPRRRPPSRGRGTAKIKQLQMVTTFTYRHSLVRIDARNFELSW